MYNYTRKSDIKKTGVDTSDFAEKDYLTRLILDVDELNVDNLKAAPTDLSKLSHVEDNNVKKSHMLNWLKN